ncbi:MAG: FAD-dependent oxidoreductase, partial [Actinomycetota bacterium]|nr:FAD-dependent oxidoreductase [Actinomycetota bacterium]
MNTTYKGPTARSTDVVVVGGGVIGLSIAWRAAAAGLTVHLFDEHPGGGASWAAAGMLAPVTEAHFGEETLLALNLEAALRYPAFVAELEALTGDDVGFRTSGTLTVARDADDAAVIRDLRGFQSELGLDVQALTSRECRAIEPALSPRIRGGIFVEGDHSIDNRRLVAALLHACERTGVHLVREPVIEIEAPSDRIRSVATPSSRVACRSVV